MSRARSSLRPTSARFYFCPVCRNVLSLNNFQRRRSNRSIAQPRGAFSIDTVRGFHLTKL